jgi:hypothetical protein
MIVSITIGASEKRSARSQFEPNNYSASLTVEQLVVERPEDLLTQASALFSMAKQSIHQAMNADGLDAEAPDITPAPTANGNGGFPVAANRLAGFGYPPVSPHSNGNGPLNLKIDRAPQSGLQVQISVIPSVDSA